MAIYMWREYQIPADALYFEANAANSTIKLIKNGSPTEVSLETSTDGATWSDYTFGATITLSSIGDKVYRRNKSGTQTGFSTSTSVGYQFDMTGSVAVSGDINYLLCKDSTTDLTASGNGCFYGLFKNCTSLTTAPKLPATTLVINCYREMFNGCTNLTQLTLLPALTLTNYCYRMMFYGCTKIKLSSTQTGTYQTAYRIPTTGTGTAGTDSLYAMFASTGGTFASAPTINTTYYTSNTLV